MSPALSFAKTLSGRQVVDLSPLIRRQSLPMITFLLHLLRLLPFLYGGHRQLALENLALRQHSPCTSERRTGRRCAAVSGSSGSACPGCGLDGEEPL